jgi:tRNA U34 5-methylaminomethyl-2-thiouridine-forming methyltransferase MnmC
MMEDSRLFITDDGSHSIFSEKYGVSYHSKYGAIEETQHVFIDAALRFKAVVQQNISILEIGFGTGLNAFVTFLEAEKRNLFVKYTAVEAYPISFQQAEQLNYSALLKTDGDTDYFLKLHHSPWNVPFQLSDQFNIEKVLKKFEEIEYQNQFDIIYFDAFAPDAQPELWDDEMLAKMYKALAPDGILVTYCAKGAVKRSLKKVGFSIEALPGPPRKREMTRATKIIDS